MGLIEYMICSVMCDEAIVRLTINEIIIPAVRKTREELANEYDVEHFWSDNFKYRGLCDEASIRIMNKIKTELDDSNLNYSIEAVHGEQRHTFYLKSKYWAYEHTWVHLKLYNHNYYIDATSEQFENIYDDIPKSFILYRKPNWFIADKNNWLWHNPWMYINRKIKVTHKDEFGSHRMDIFDYLVYIVWGRISDWIGSKLN